MNALAEHLTRLCREHLLDEKWLLAPSRRVGQQWLDAVARTGQPVVNVRVKTLKSLAVELASGELGGFGRLLSPLAGMFLVGRLWHRLKEQTAGRMPAPDDSFLWALHPSPSLFSALFRAVKDLRLADVTPEKISPQALESRPKARDLARLFVAYQAELKKTGQLDDADLYRLAIARLQSGTAALVVRDESDTASFNGTDDTKNPGFSSIPSRSTQARRPCHNFRHGLPGHDVLMLLPADVRGTGLEAAFLHALPAEQVRTLVVDEPAPADAKPEAANDLALLRWIHRPAEAPPAKNDGSVSLFTAVGEINEVREVFRRTLRAGWPLDTVEVLYSDEAYLPLIYETAQRLRPLPEEASGGLPLTFAAGLPAAYSRPGRALVGWLNWIREDHPQELFLRLLEDGLLAIPGQEESGFSFVEMARVLSGVPIFTGRQRYWEKLSQALEATKKRMAPQEIAVDEDGEPIPAHTSPMAHRRLAGLQLLLDFIRRLLAVTPLRSAPSGVVLASAEAFLTSFARAGNESDQFSRQALQEKVQEARELQQADAELDVLDTWAWLTNLPAQTHVGGSAPRAGHLHVSPLDAGGHTARPHTFILGLDDGRFPGTATQDPLLLDSERGRLSDGLPTAAERMKAQLEAFGRLLARLRGTLTLSYSSRDLLDDREQFPSPVLLSAYRLLSGEREGDQSGMLRWLAETGPPASFAPRAPADSLDAGEWWLSQLTGGEKISNLGAVMQQHFPHLAHGQEAEKERAGSVFTVYDGRLSHADADLNPMAAAGPVLSASRLETIGACPLRYFFGQVLDVQRPEETAVTPDKWLDALSFGSLLHEVFRAFLAELIEQERLPPVYERDISRLRELLDEQIGHYRDLIPPPSEAVYRRDRLRLEQAIHIFLVEEADHCRQSQPVYLEALLGQRRYEGLATPLDQETPVALQLPDGRSVRVRGRLDRVDRLLPGAPERYAVWDYKTGSAKHFQHSEPFLEGRKMQHWLYLTLAGQALREKLGGRATVEFFGYFFPTAREAGKRLTWQPQDLAPGGEILQRLCEIPARGAFCATTDSKDCIICDYAAVCGDVEQVAQCARLKLENPENELLNPMRELRGK